MAHRPATRSVARSAIGLGLVAVTLGGLVALILEGPVRSRTAHEAPGAPSALVPEASPAGLGHFSLPSGAPLGIACEDAQRVTLFMQRELSTAAIPPLPSELVDPWAGLLDPHGLWSAAPDGPLRGQLVAAAGDMLASLHQRSSACGAAERIAAAFEPWLAELARVYDAAFDAARLRAALPQPEVFRLAAEPIFQDDPVLRPAVDLAQELGDRLSGKPLQQIGLTPDIVLPLPPPSEREATITRQPITFEGPDVRAAFVRPGPAWPSARGAVGPCEDALVCTAISRLSSPRPAPRAARSRPGTR